MLHFLHLSILSLILILTTPFQLVGQEDVSKNLRFAYDYKEIDSKEEYVGIGIIIEKERDYPYMHVREVLKSGPAHKAGLKKGDKVVKINDVSVINKNLEEVAELMLGPENSEVKIDFMRKHRFYEVEIKRQSISF